MTLLDRSVNLLNRGREATVTYKPPSGLPFTWTVIVGAQTGVEVIDETGRVKKLVKTHVIGKASELIASGVTQLQPYAKVEAAGMEWTIDPTDTRWGTPLVRLGLEREALLREYQAQRNAAV